MSGRQAKKKRQNAEKEAAAKPTPVAAARPRTDFVIENVRCFAGRQRAPIRPLTLLVGENSTGKTTFLGCLYTALNLLRPSHKNLSGNGVNFNTPPFAMGGFRDIVHRNGKEVGDEFRIGFAVAYPGSQGDDALLFSYKERDIKAVAVKASFAFGDGKQLEAAAEEAGSVLISGPGFQMRTPWHQELPLSPMPVMTTALMLLGPERKDESVGQKEARRFLKEKMGVSSADLQPDSIFSHLLEGEQMMSEQFAMAFAPGRANPKRTYSVLDEEPEDEGGRVPAFMFRLSRKDPEQWRDLRKRLTAFGREAEMFTDFNVATHGASAGGDFHLEVKTRGAKANIADVGYGVSQVYPLLVPVMRASQRKIPMVFLFQEPEIHLHPQAQAALASFLAKAAKEPGRGFVVETHGDNIIDRVRICVSNGLIPPEDVVILYFEPRAKGDVKIHPIHLDAVANLRGAPKGYRKFFVEEDDRLLGFKPLPKVGSHVRHR